VHRICSRVGRGSSVVLLLMVLAVIGGACGGGAADTSTSQPTTAAAAVATEPAAQESASAEPTSDSPSGLVAFRFNAPWTSAELTLIDPVTGATTPWRTFDAASAGIDHIELPSFPQTLEVTGLLGQSLTRNVFSPDYSRMAATTANDADGSEHVGWLTSDGEFVDVTAAVHAGQSDFADAPQDTGPSFGNDGLFYWYDKNESKFKRIDPSSLEPSAAEVISKDKVCRAFGLRNLDDKEGRYVYSSVYVSDRGLYATMSTGVFADWIDGERYLVEDYTIGVGKATASPTADAPPVKDVLPASNRTNWNPLASPGGDQFAFLSSNPNQAGTELFVVPVDGGDPTRVDTDYEFTQSNEGQLGVSPPHDLLDWL
jgi:hypothetical protein